MIRPRALTRFRDWIREVRAARVSLFRDEPTVARAIHAGRWE